MEIENAPFKGGWINIEVPEHSEEEISYHVLLLADAGLIEAINLGSMSRVCWMPKRLTYDGHEFLDAARDQTRWAKAKEAVIKNTGTLTLEALKIALAALIKQAITG